jgi:SAM-dependent methyltransferase
MSFFQLIRDRLNKQSLYATAAYWDKKAETYRGLAQSNWPSNAYNTCMHARQVDVIDEMLGDVRGRSIVDVGCGTGRVCLHLARRGARMTGLDFSENALAQARTDAAGEGLEVQFQKQDLLGPPLADLAETFDALVTVGCLGVACTSRSAFERALDGAISLVRPGGRLLFLEPVHRSRLLRRMLELSVDEWIDAAERRGLKLCHRAGICCVPSRYALAFAEVPETMAATVFRLGERVLAVHPGLERLADYKVLLFQRRGGDPRP